MNSNKVYKIGFFSLVFFNLLTNICFHLLNTPLNSDMVVHFFFLPDLLNGRTYLPPDNFIFQIPLFALSRDLFGLTPFSFHIVTFFYLLTFWTGFFFLYKEILSKLGKISFLSYLPLFFLINMTPLYHELITQELRTALAGLVFFALYLLCKPITKWSVGILTLLFTITLFNDPLFLFTIFIPLCFSAIVSLLLVRKVEDQTFAILATVTLSFFLSYLLRIVSSALFYIYPSKSHLGDIFMNTSFFLQSIVHYFPITIFSLSFEGVVSVLNLFILLLGSTGLIMYWIKRKNDVLALFFLLTISATSLAFIVSGTIEDEGSRRYLFLLPFFLSLGLLHLIQLFKQKWIKILFCISIILISYSHISTSSMYSFTKSKDFYSSNKQILSLLEKEQLSYGYSSYSMSALNTFLSNETIKIRQVRCFSKGVGAYRWLANESWYDSSPLPNKTFIFYENSIQGNNYCMENPPPNAAEKISIDIEGKRYTLLIYNYNVATQF